MLKKAPPASDGKRPEAFVAELAAACGIRSYDGKAVTPAMVRNWLNEMDGSHTSTMANDVFRQLRQRHQAAAGAAFPADPRRQIRLGMRALVNLLGKRN